jgi:3-hydroxyisobutyrate dehydrogenase
LLIDCSTIDIDSARAVHAAAEKAGFDFLDAPVSGGVGGAEAATLAFMCGGSDTAFKRAEPILEKMGKRIVHAGGAGAGQAAKICNNMLLAISMIGTCEAFVLGEKLGLDPQKLFDIMSAASGQCWSLTTYCPVPGPVPTAPSNRDYTGGFATALMLKDLKLAQGAAQSAGAAARPRRWGRKQPSFTLCLPQKARAPWIFRASSICCAERSRSILRAFNESSLPCAQTKVGLRNSRGRR